MTSKDPSTSVERDKDFRDLLVAIIPSLRAFARGLCGNRDLADDMVQDAMTRAWAARESFAPGSNFRAWIFMILRNHYYTTLRKNARVASWDPELAERVLVGAGVGNGVGVGPVFRMADRSQRELSSAIGSRHNLIAIRDAIESVADDIEQAGPRVVRA